MERDEVAGRRENVYTGFVTSLRAMTHTRGPRRALAQTSSIDREADLRAGGSTTVMKWPLLSLTGK